MAKTIKIPYGGKNYTLEYTRKTVSMMEKQGFKIGGLTEQMATMVPLLFNGAFYANHEKVKNETKDTIWNSLKSREKLTTALAEMYYDTYATLLGNEEDEADEGNSGWEVVE